MSAAEFTHSPAPEEVMAYLDGEATTLPRDAMEAHLAACEHCRRLAAELRGVSGQARAWTVDATPGSLRAPHAAPHRPPALAPAWRPRVVMGALGVAAALLIVFSTNSRQMRNRPVALANAVEATKNDTRSAGRDRGGAVGGLAGGVVGGVVGGLPEAPAPPPPAVDAVSPQAFAGARAQGQTSPRPRGPMVIRTATLHVVVKEFGSVRATVEGIVNQAGGFIDRLTVEANSAAARSLSGSLRVPSDRMAAVLDRLRQIGLVVEDTQGAEEVTDQIVDLDARLASARATEQRLTELLRQRTGKLSDVLEVERELTRVRLDIERLDAQKTNVSRRVTYATIELQIAEERKAGLETGPLPLSTRIRVAAADGTAAALESIVAVLLWLLQSGPSLLTWGTAAAVAWLALRRRISGWRARSTASE